MSRITKFLSSDKATEVLREQHAEERVSQVWLK